MRLELNELIVRILKDNEDLVFIAIRQRAKFEGWLKFELARKLQLSYSDLKVEYPYPDENKKHADIYANNAFIELKTSNTNYRFDKCESLTRPITKNISSIITDINKLRDIKNYKKYIAFVLFPIDEEEQYLEHIKRIENEDNIKLIMQTIKIHDVPLLVCSAEV